jgi:hypothetical protein
MSSPNVKFLLEQFDLGKVPIVSLENVTVILSKEVGQHDYDLLHVRIEEMDIKKWVRKERPISEVYEEGRKRKGNNNQTAGQVPFVMFFAKKIYKKFQSGRCVGNVSAQKAALFDLASNVEMRTGRLIKGWENDSHNGKASMSIADIAKVIGKKDRQARTILHDLITNGFINKHKDGYYLNRDFFIRGKSWERDL